MMRAFPIAAITLAGLVAGFYMLDLADLLTNMSEGEAR